MIVSLASRQQERCEHGLARVWGKLVSPACDWLLGVVP